MFIKEKYKQYFYMTALYCYLRKKIWKRDGLKNSKPRMNRDLK